MKKEIIKNELLEKIEIKAEKMFECFNSWMDNEIEFKDLNEKKKEAWLNLALGKNKNIEKEKQDKERMKAIKKQEMQRAKQDKERMKAIKKQEKEKEKPLFKI